jgi:hypothetical protein
MEDCVQNVIGTLRVPGYAIRAYERPSYFLGIHQQCPAKVSRRVYGSLP